MRQFNRLVRQSRLRDNQLRMVQLWVNLPARDKTVAGGYQSLLGTDIPTMTLPDKAGMLRVIAGEYAGVRGPARTYTPVNVWDGRLAAGTEVTLALPEGHVAMLVLLVGKVTVNNGRQAREAEMVLLSPSGHDAKIQVHRDATLLALTGQPIDEPVVGHAPFVMNTREEISQAIADLQSGRFGKLAA